MSIPTDVALGPPPRKAHLRRAIRNMRRAYRTLFALVILVFGGWAVLDGMRWYALAYQVRTTEGKITKKHTTPRPPVQEYHLEYSFTTDDGTDIAADTVVPLALYDKVAEEQTVPIVYLPANPRVNHWLFDNNSARFNMMALAIGHALAALLASAVWRLVESPLGRELRLARHGVAALGEIVTVGKARGRRGIVKITYTFRTAAGAPVQGTCNLPRRFPAHTLEPGTPITILYDPRRRRLHRPRLAMDAVEFGDPKSKPV
jgi:hypothetical protein